MDEETRDRPELEKQVKANQRNIKALFALACFVTLAATPSIISEWHLAIEDGKITSLDVRSRSFELSWLERLVIIFCFFSALGVIAQKQLVWLLSIVLKKFDKD